MRRFTTLSVISAMAIVQPSLIVNAQIGLLQGVKGLVNVNDSPATDTAIKIKANVTKTGIYSVCVLDDFKTENGETITEENFLSNSEKVYGNFYKIPDGTIIYYAKTEAEKQRVLQEQETKLGEKEITIKSDGSFDLSALDIPETIKSFRIILSFDNAGYATTLDRYIITGNVQITSSGQMLTNQEVKYVAQVIDGNKISTGDLTKGTPVTGPINFNVTKINTGSSTTNTPIYSYTPKVYVQNDSDKERKVKVVMYDNNNSPLNTQEVTVPANSKTMANFPSMTITVNTDYRFKMTGDGNSETLYDTKTIKINLPYDAETKTTKPVGYVTENLDPNFATSESNVFYLKTKTQESNEPLYNPVISSIDLTTKGTSEPEFNLLYLGLKTSGVSYDPTKYATDEDYLNSDEYKAFMDTYYPTFSLESGAVITTGKNSLPLTFKAPGEYHFGITPKNSTIPQNMSTNTIGYEVTYVVDKDMKVNRTALIRKYINDLGVQEQETATNLVYNFTEIAPPTYEVDVPHIPLHIDGQADETYNFILYNPNGSENQRVSVKVNSVNDAEVVFPKRIEVPDTFPLVYTIKQVQGSKTNIEYDSNIISLTMTKTGNTINTDVSGTFTNKVSPEVTKDEVVVAISDSKEGKIELYNATSDLKVSDKTNIVSNLKTGETMSLKDHLVADNYYMIKISTGESDEVFFKALSSGYLELLQGDATYDKAKNLLTVKYKEPIVSEQPEEALPDKLTVVIQGIHNDEPYVIKDYEITDTAGKTYVTDAEGKITVSKDTVFVNPLSRDDATVNVYNLPKTDGYYVFTVEMTGSSYTIPCLYTIQYKDGSPATGLTVQLDNGETTSASKEDESQAGKYVYWDTYKVPSPKKVIIKADPSKGFTEDLIYDFADIVTIDLENLNPETAEYQIVLKNHDGAIEPNYTISDKAGKRYTSDVNGLIKATKTTEFRDYTNYTDSEPVYIEVSKLPKEGTNYVITLPEILGEQSFLSLELFTVKYKNGTPAIGLTIFTVNDVETEETIQHPDGVYQYTTSSTIPRPTKAIIKAEPSKGITKDLEVPFADEIILDLDEPTPVIYSATIITSEIIGTEKDDKVIYTIPVKNTSNVDAIFVVEVNGVRKEYTIKSGEIGRMDWEFDDSVTQSINVYHETELLAHHEGSYDTTISTPTADPFVKSGLSQLTAKETEDRIFEVKIPLKNTGNTKGDIGCELFQMGTKHWEVAKINASDGSEIGPAGYAVDGTILTLKNVEPADTREVTLKLTYTEDEYATMPENETVQAKAFGANIRMAVDIYKAHTTYVDSKTGDTKPKGTGDSTKTDTPSGGITDDSKDTKTLTTSSGGDTGSANKDTKQDVSLTNGEKGNNEVINLVKDKELEKVEVEAKKIPLSEVNNRGKNTAVKTNNIILPTFVTFLLSILTVVFRKNQQTNNY